MQRSLFIRHGQHFQPQSSLASSQTTSQGREARVWEDFFILRENHPANAEFYQIESIMGANGRQIYPYAEPDIRIRALALDMPSPMLKSW
jgi:hypothetical protein